MSEAALGNKSVEVLETFVARIERLDGEIAGLNEDKKYIYEEAESGGFDKKALKLVIQARRKRNKDSVEYDHQLDLFDTYMAALDGHPVETRRTEESLAPAPVPETAPEAASGATEEPEEAPEDALGGITEPIEPDGMPDDGGEVDEATPEEDDSFLSDE